MNGWVGLGYMIVFVVLANLLHAKVNPRPRHYARRGLVVITPINFLNEEKWTPAGVEYHKKMLLFGAHSLVAFAVGYMGLAILF